MSSMTVSVSRKIRSWVETAGPTSAITPSRNAVSVPMTAPHPAAASPDGLSARKIAAGTSMPMTPATSGTTTRLRSTSSPMANSLRTSRPMTKKNTTIRPSLIQWCRSIVRPPSPNLIDSSVCHRST